MDTATNYAALFYSATGHHIDVLKKNAEDFPVSSFARFLLLYHYKINNDPGFENLAKQTAPYLSDPLWMEYQLFQAENFTPDNFSNIPDFKNTVEEKSAFTEPGKELPFEGKKEELVSEFNNESIEEALPVNEVLDQISEKTEGENEELSSVKNTEEELPVAINEEIIPISILENKNIGGENEQKNEIETASVSAIIPVEEETNNDSLKETNEEKTEEEKSVNEIKIPEEEKDNSDQKTFSAPNSSEQNEEEEDLFEPLHTVDYFASQGIKISEDALNDNLGKQVKSFTAWLKSMKKLHPGQIPEQNEVVERLIQASSEVSNQNANVLTEAMAEVLVKQGKQEKAIEMYQKLSLLNPSKSAYFAAKIESLKTV